MTREEKDLLLRDLYRRLPYGVIVETYWEFENKKEKTFPKTILTYRILEYYIGEDKWKYNTHFLPYLRPMSSMTEEEKKEFHHLAGLQRNYLGDGNFYTHYQMIDWLDKNMFDYRGLIPMGLALEAKPGMYNLQ